MSALRVALLSAQGSPGVTVTALALAANAGPDGLFVELDPAGGSLECWTARTGEPGLLGLVSELRRPVSLDGLAAQVVEIPAGVQSILAPTPGPTAEAALSAAGEQLIDAVGVMATKLVVVDAGRWASSQLTARRVVGVDVIGIVCRSTLGGVEHARWLVEPLRAMTGMPVVMVLVGDRGYAGDEVAAALGVPCVGVMAWDSRGVDALVSSGVGAGWPRRPLARSAHQLRVALERVAASVTVRGG